MKNNKLILNPQEIIKIIGQDYSNFSYIFSDKVGIVNAVLERQELKKYGLSMYQCLSCNAKDLFGLSREVSSGGLGVDANEKGALISCLAEALERYCMSFVPKGDLQFEFFSNLNIEHRLDRFYTYSKEQYDHCSFANPYEEKIYWTKIKSINGKDWKFWPASLIYLPFDFKSPIAETTSTGMAAGFSVEECIRGGLLELIERDALMINFLQHLNPPELNLNSLTGGSKNLLQNIKSEFNVKIYKLYTDIKVPVFLSYIYKKEHGKIHYGIGASANLDSDVAIEKSLKECLFTYFYSKNLLKFRKDRPEQINTLYEHFLYYQGENFNDLLFDSKIIDYDRETLQYSDLLNSLKQQGIDIYYKEMTTNDIKSTNLNVVKVVAPGLIDLNKNHNLPRLGADRFWTVPKKLGLSAMKEVNKMPHPFP